MRFLSVHLLILFTVLHQSNGFLGKTKPNPQPIHAKSPPGTSHYDIPYPYVGTSVTAALLTMTPSQSTTYDGRDKDKIRVDIAGQGPVLWSVSRWNQGDLSPRLSPRHPFAQTNLNDFPGADGFAADSAKDFSAQSWRPDIEKGVMLATVAKNGEEWSDGAPRFYGTAACVTDSRGFGYSMKTGQFGNSNPNLDVTLGKAGLKGEAVIDVAVAWFPYEQGWTAGYIDSPSSYSHDAEPKWVTPDSHSPDLPANLSEIVKWSERGARLRLPGVKPYTDGMLFLTSTDPGNSNNDLNILGAYTRPWGKGWRVQAREDKVEDPTSLVDSSEHMFAFLYVPFSATGLIGGNVGSDGSIVRGAGNFEVRKVTVGTYAIKIVGLQTGQSDGLLLLQVTGRDENERKYAKHAFLSYNYSEGGVLVVESHKLQFVRKPEGVLEETFPLEDTAFSFLWVDFTHPLTPERDMFTGRLPVAVSYIPYWFGFFVGIGLGAVGVACFLILAHPFVPIARLNLSRRSLFSRPQPLIPAEAVEEEMLRGPYAPAESRS